MSDMADYWKSVLRQLIQSNATANLTITAEDLEFAFGLNSSSPSFAPPTPLPCYCGGTLRQVASNYRQIHGYLSLIVCVFGTVANLLNIAVLSRQRRPACASSSGHGPGSSSSGGGGGSASVVRILVGIAVADVLVMLEYVPFAAYMYVYTPPGQKRFSHTEAVYILVHMHFSQLMHTVSISLTLTLALWRYLAVQLPHRPQRALCSPQRLPLALASAVGLSALICVPSYFVFSVRATLIVENHQEVTLYHLDLSDLARRDGELAYAAYFWLYAVVLKLLPCALLTALSYRLLSLLWQVNARRERLRSSCNEDKDRAGQSDRDRRRPDHRTSGMLVAVLLLFLITEVPQGVLGLLSGVLGHCFFRNCYHQLGELLDILALLNGAVTFILYCWMSRQFRDTFAHMFKRLAPLPAHPRQPLADHHERDLQTTFV